MKNNHISTHISISVFASVFLFVLLGCKMDQSIENTYRAWLESPGGELAFPLIIKKSGDSLNGYVVNGIDTSRFTRVVQKNDSIFLSYDYYDSHIEAEIKNSGSLEGHWHRRAEDGERSSLPFKADPYSPYLRYSPTDPEGYPFDGDWQATFADDEGTFPAHGIFVSEPSGRLHGTFATETGDYRFLNGYYTDSTMTLSTFDGTHAFLFKARLQSNGEISGDFWSRDTYHATFTAQKGPNRLQNPMEIAAASVIGNNMSFSFPDINGNVVSTGDESFINKPMLVYLFGSWCPNCADEAEMMKEFYHDRYKDTKLKIVGLAFEYTGNYESDVEMVHKYKERFDIPWPLLVAGSSDKENAADVLPFIDDVTSFPTSFFVDDDHVIQAVHVGFNGPATGARYYRERQRFRENIEAVLEN